MSAQGPPPHPDGPQGQPPIGPPPADYPGRQPTGHDQPRPGYPPQQPSPGYGYPTGGSHRGHHPANSGHPPANGSQGKASWQLILGGVLTIVYASFILFMGLVLLAIGGLANDLERAFGELLSGFSAFFFIIALIVLAIGTFGLIAGIQTIRRSRVGWILTYVFMGFMTFLLAAGLFDGDAEAGDVFFTLLLLAGAVTVIVVISLAGARKALKA